MEAGWSSLVSVVLCLEWTLGRKSSVLSLNVGHLLELDSKLGQVKAGDLLIEQLGQNVDTKRVFALLGIPECNLGKDLVGEGHGHDKGWVSSGTSQVDKSALSEQNDVVTIWHQESIDLRLNVGDRLCVGLKPRNVNFDVEVSDVADNGVILHDGELL